MYFFFIETDECKSSPCLNGGTCVDGLYNFTCVCPSVFIGQRCEGRVTLQNLTIAFSWFRVAQNIVKEVFKLNETLIRLFMLKRFDILTLTKFSIDFRE